MIPFHLPELAFVVSVFWVHLLADFVYQTDDMAKNKSTSNAWLNKHIRVYSTILLFSFGPVYAVVNGLLHWIIDYFSSRASSKRWKEGKVHDFFVIIGIDQALHMTCLVLTLPLVWWPFI